MYGIEEEAQRQVGQRTSLGMPSLDAEWMLALTLYLDNKHAGTPAVLCVGSVQMHKEMLEPVCECISKAAKRRHEQWERGKCKQ